MEIATRAGLSETPSPHSRFEPFSKLPRPFMASSPPNYGPAVGMPDDQQQTHEQGWVEAIRRGDERAFEEMFHAYYPRLCSCAATYVVSFDTAREVVQDVLLRIWESRSDWQVQVTLKAYLYRAVRNQALNYLKRDKKRRMKETYLDKAEPISGVTGEEALKHNELLQAYQKALEELPERRRTAFILHRQHGLSYAEIAQVMSISERTVEVHISKALEFLRKLLFS